MSETHEKEAKEALTLDPTGQKESALSKSRKEMVEKIIDMMKNEGFFRNMAEWNRYAFRPHNPLTNTVYRGGNRFRLMFAAYLAGYEDPRWATFKQISKAGYHLKKGSKGVHCEKWTAKENTIYLDKEGNKVRKNDPRAVSEDKEIKMVGSVFTVFNMEQVEGFPEMEELAQTAGQEEVFMIADRLIRSSRCPVYEKMQGQAFYSLNDDSITLPPRAIFKDAKTFTKTLAHEMGHSTGHGSRLNIQMAYPFGSREYAMEELRAELASIFIGSDLNLDLACEHYQDHSDYLKSWIQILTDDYNYLFTVASKAQKAADLILGDYYELLRNESGSIVIEASEGLTLENNEMIEQVIAAAS